MEGRQRRLKKGPHRQYNLNVFIAFLDVCIVSMDLDVNAVAIASNGGEGFDQNVIDAIKSVDSAEIERLWSIIGIH